MDSVSSYAGPAIPPIRSLGEFSSAVQASGKAGAPVALRRVLPMPVLLLKTFYARRQDMTAAKQGNMMQGVERGMKMVEIRATLVEIELLRKLLKTTRKLLSPQWVDSCEAGWPEGWTASVIIPQPDSGEKVCPVCGQLAKNKCSGCQQVSYCGRECQRSDWKAHKKECKTGTATKNARKKKKKEEEAARVRGGSGREPTMKEFEEGVLAGKSVKELKMVIEGGGLSHADCFEKPELRRRAADRAPGYAGRGDRGRERGGCARHASRAAQDAARRPPPAHAPPQHTLQAHTHCVLQALGLAE